MRTHPTLGLGKPGRLLPTLILLAVLCTALTAKPAQATLSINTSNAKDWVITNGTLKLDWDSTGGRVFGVYLNGVNLVDTTSGSAGLYMDNTGIGSGTVTSGYHQGGSSYIDWWITVASSSTNPFTFTQHFILTDNDTGFSVYNVIQHSATDIAGSIGQDQYVFRISQSLFDNTYSVDPGLNNLGDFITPLPTISSGAANDPGRNVQNAVLDLHGLSLPSGYGREFETKYDYCSYEYLHKAHGVYGSTYGAWTVVPSTDSLEGGPTKQELIFTGNILMMECLSGHLDNNVAYTPPQGANTTHILGPFYFHFNQFSGTIKTPADMYQDALNAAGAMTSAYDYEGILHSNGYVASTSRGSVTPFITGAGSSTTNKSWSVLSDQGKNFQLSSLGHQYWVNENTDGDATLYNVIPGTYRLSSYVLGEWGEMRDDGITATAGANSGYHGLTFVPENFSSSAPIWTLGTPDRSAHEFLHGHNSSGQDDREYYGNWNFWKDFTSNSGAVNYYATADGSHAATNNLDDWNYVQWANFDPGLFGGYYKSGDDTTDGYNYIVPSYVGDPATAACPPWTVHFTTSSAQLAQGKYAVLSVALAGTNGDVLANLNGKQQLIFRGGGNESDPTIRSGLSGTFQWIVLQWDASRLNAAGADNVLTLSTNHGGVMYDALRFEITNTSADPAVRGWHDYEYLYNTTDTPADDSVPNP